MYFTELIVLSYDFYSIWTETSVKYIVIQYIQFCHVCLQCCLSCCTGYTFKGFTLQWFRVEFSWGLYVCLSVCLFFHVYVYSNVPLVCGTFLLWRKGFGKSDFIMMLILNVRRHRVRALFNRVEFKLAIQLQFKWALTESQGTVWTMVSKALGFFLGSCHSVISSGFVNWQYF